MSWLYYGVTASEVDVDYFTLGVRVVYRQHGRDRTISVWGPGVVCLRSKLRPADQRCSRDCAQWSMPPGDLSYQEVGATRLHDEAWASGPRRLESRVRVGSGDDCWSASAEAVMRWAVKTRSGFRVIGEPIATLGTDNELVFRCAGLSVREPVRVVGVVDQQSRRGFAYGTRLGHPVAGEEAFIVHRDPTGEVWLTIRSVTMPAPGWRTIAFPIFLLAQRALRRRYLRRGLARESASGG